MRLMRMTLVVSSGLMMMVVLASSPKIQSAFSGGSHSAISSREENPEARIKVQIEAAQATSVGFVSPSSKSAPNGTAWYGTKEISMQDAGELFTAEPGKSSGTVVSSMPRSRIPVRKGGFRAFE